MRSSSLVVGIVSLAVLASACGGDDRAHLGDAFVVMTHDLGVGADLEAVFAASTADVPARVDEMWAQRDATSFAARAGALAAGIALYNPSLLGIQSVIQWRQQIPASAAPAEEVVEDYLELLVSALAARGLAYDPVAITTTTDIELTGAAGNDYRLIDREVILARHGVVQVVSVTGGTYAAQRTIPIATPPVVDGHGWALANVVRDGRFVRFLSTSLDPKDAAVQRAQAAELAALAAGPTPSVIAGNLGSNPEQPSSPAFGILQGRGTPFLDLTGGVGAGFPSCCRDVLLSDPAAHLDRRADWLLGYGHLTSWWGSWVNGNGAVMTGGRWASDHAGIVAGIALFD